MFSLRTLTGVAGVLPAARRRRARRAGSVPAIVAQPFFPSHRHLLGDLDRERWPGSEDHRPDAIVVPSYRPAGATRSGLRFAARLAVENNCPLVVMASYEAGSAAAVDALGEEISVETPQGPLTPDTLVLRISQKPSKLTTFEADQLPISRAYRRGGDVFGEGRLRPNDVGRKRNLALLLAAAQKWHSILFLDDDMFDAVDGEGVAHQPHERTLDTRSLRSAVQAVRAGHLAVGWAGRDFDDNSVLCRMAACTGAAQDQFIGGGALLVPVDVDTPFFPAIYNEDWLFLLPLLSRRRLGHREVLYGGDVHQDEYPVFLRRTAAASELGDILGEALVALLHDDGGSDQIFLPAFWENALDERRAMVARLRTDVTQQDHPLKGDMLAVLEVVDEIHARLWRERRFWVDQFICFVRAWRRDLATWARRLDPVAAPSSAKLVRSQEFDAARTFGTFAHPEDFLQMLASTSSRGHAELPLRA